MREGVNKFERVIVICSANSLSRRGVLNEIEETLQREARDGGASYLIRIRYARISSSNLPLKLSGLTRPMVQSPALLGTRYWGETITNE